MDLFCRRAGVCRTATDVCNAAANLNCALCGLLDVACNFLCRGTLLFDSRCARGGYFRYLSDCRADLLDGRNRL
jgi:hypothetical protein